MSTKTYKIIEFVLLFILLPTSFAFNYALKIKTLIAVLGFIYIIYVLVKIENTPIKRLNLKVTAQLLKPIAVKLLLIAIATTGFVWFTNKELLFNVPLNNPKLWMGILFGYSIFSVYPQELMYRTFYFYRYANLFKNKKWLIIINALVFSLAHLLFKNTLVLIITGIGGLLFALTYNQTKSTIIVSIEHALYGCWLFTVGMGNMLGFPS